MKLPVLVLISVATVLLPAARGADTNNSDPVVAMPPFRVDEFSSYLGFAWNAVLKEQKISTVRFSRVEPRSLSARAGLMVNDHLIAIDGHPVVGLDTRELQQLFSRNWKPGDTLTWEFTVERGGLFPRRHTLTLRMKTRGPEPTERNAVNGN